mgnify:FL=1
MGAGCHKELWVAIVWSTLFMFIIVIVINSVITIIIMTVVSMVWKFCAFKIPVMTALVVNLASMKGFEFCCKSCLNNLNCR